MWCTIAGIYYDVQEITPKAVGVFRFNDHDEEVDTYNNNNNLFYIASNPQSALKHFTCNVMPII